MIRGSQSTPLYSGYLPHSPYLKRPSPPGSPLANQRQPSSAICYDHEIYRRESIFCCCYAYQEKNRKTSLLVTFGVCCLVVLYTFFGAFVFMALEGSGANSFREPSQSVQPSSSGNKPSSSAQSEDTLAGVLRSQTVERLWSITENLNILYKENWTKLAAEEVLVFQESLFKVLNDYEGNLNHVGYYHGGHHHHKWSFSSSFLYSLTLITTIAIPSGDRDEETKEVPVARSPIDLYTHKAQAVVNEPFQFIGFNRELHPEIINDGHTVKLAYTEETTVPKILGGGLRFPEYRLQNIHFHWESDHSINGRKFEAECHFQFIASQFKSVQRAGKMNGLAVLASVWRFSDAVNPSIESILGAHHKISKYPKIPTYAEFPVNISQLLPENTTNYFRYEGSTTYEPFYPNTTTVFAERVSLTRRQLYTLSDIYNEVGDPIIYNSLETIKSKNAPKVFFNGNKNSCKCLKSPY